MLFQFMEKEFTDICKISVGLAVILLSTTKNLFSYHQKKSEKIKLIYNRYLKKITNLTAKKA